MNRICKDKCLEQRKICPTDEFLLCLCFLLFSSFSQPHDIHPSVMKRTYDTHKVWDFENEWNQKGLCSCQPRSRCKNFLRLPSLIERFSMTIRLFRMLLLLLYGLQSRETFRRNNDHRLFTMFHTLHANKNSSSTTY